MTYVSRRTRITVSRWTDECDAEYLLRASRKRSDGRLKRHTSCEDSRAWINDNCIKNEYLVDLMSNGEFLGKPSFRLFGRFIPVPILFKLAQSSIIQNDVKKSCETQEENEADDKCNVRERYSDSTKHRGNENLKIGTDSRNENLKVKSDSNLTAIQWEKNALEKSLVKCTSLLNKALRKLEQIDGIVGSVKEETENLRNQEIQEAFYKSKLSCICPQNQSSSTRSSLCNFSENLLSSKVDLKIQRAKRNELLRKISGLRKKLKKLRLYEDIHQISTSQQKTEHCFSHFQLTELCSCPEQTKIKGLQKNSEKLKAEKKRLVSEMCQTLTALNAIKKSSKSYLEFRKRDSMHNENYCDFQNTEPQEFRNCNCGCNKSSDKFSNSEKPESFESFSAENKLSKKFDEPRQMDENLCSDYRISSSEYPLRSSLDCRNLDLEKQFENNSRSAARIEAIEKNSNPSKSNNASVYRNSKHYQQSESLLEKKSKNSKEKEEALNTVKKSKIKFVCEESPCNIYADDLSAYESSSSKQTVILKAVKNIQSIQNFRPSTTPTTKREKLESQNYTDEQNSKLFGNIPERRVKSEATMKEIEKTLRNYEQRLRDIESLESKVEELKEKSLEAYQLQKRLNKVKADAEKVRAADRENSYRERTRLCWENWELKKEIHRLMKKSVAQSNNIQNLNCTMMKLKCETEELKKELSEYQVDFEYQQNYIFKCECKLAKWGAEIKNLNNHIRKLAADRIVAYREEAMDKTSWREDGVFGSLAGPTTVIVQSMKEAPCSPCQDSRCIQRSRSYSPENIKERIMTTRPKTQARGYRTPSEEEVFCCCRGHEQLKGSRNVRQRLLLPMRQKNVN